MRSNQNGNDTATIRPSRLGRVSSVAKCSRTDPIGPIKTASGWINHAATGEYRNGGSARYGEMPDPERWEPRPDLPIRRGVPLRPGQEPGDQDDVEDDRSDTDRTGPPFRARDRREGCSRWRGRTGRRWRSRSRARSTSRSSSVDGRSESTGARSASAFPLSGGGWPVMWRGRRQSTFVLAPTSSSGRRRRPPSPRALR